MSANARPGRRRFHVYRFPADAPMISNELDFQPFRQQLAAQRRVQVGQFLQPAAAERLHQCLLHEVPWTLAERIDGRSHSLEAASYSALDADSRRVRLDAAYRRAESGFQYVYDSYPMVEAAKEGRDPGLALHGVLQFLNSPPFIQFARWFSGAGGIDLVTAQATRYLPGHFLTVHDDEVASEGRVLAYVINLSRDWQADWGGLLQFIGSSGEVVQSFLPRYNSLSLFHVPQQHSVSLVSPWAAAPRLAITGWFLDRSRPASCASLPAQQ